MTSRNHPSAAFWATVMVVVALAGYPLSFGPACWFATRGAWDSPGRTAVLYGYYPVLWIGQVVPDRVGQVIDSYARSIAIDGSSPGLLGNGEPTWFYAPPPALFRR